MIEHVERPPAFMEALAGAVSSLEDDEEEQVRTNDDVAVDGRGLVISGGQSARSFSSVDRGGGAYLTLSVWTAPTSHTKRRQRQRQRQVEEEEGAGTWF